MLSDFIYLTWTLLNNWKLGMFWLLICISKEAFVIEIFSLVYFRGLWAKLTLNFKYHPIRVSPFQKQMALELQAWTPRHSRACVCVYIWSRCDRDCICPVSLPRRVLKNREVDVGWRGTHLQSGANWMHPPPLPPMLTRWVAGVTRDSVPLLWTGVGGGRVWKINDFWEGFFFVLVRGSKPDGSDIFNCGLFNPRGVDKLCGRIFQYYCVTCCETTFLDAKIFSFSNLNWNLSSNLEQIPH